MCLCFAFVLSCSVALFARSTFGRPSSPQRNSSFRTLREDRRMDKPSLNTFKYQVMCGLNLSCTSIRRSSLGFWKLLPELSSVSCCLPFSGGRGLNHASVDLKMDHFQLGKGSGWKMTWWIIIEHNLHDWLGLCSAEWSVDALGRPWGIPDGLRPCRSSATRHKVVKHQEFGHACQRCLCQKNQISLYFALF